MSKDVFNDEVPRFKGKSAYTFSDEIIEGAGCYTDVSGKPYIIVEGDGDMPVFKKVEKIQLDHE